MSVDTIVCKARTEWLCKDEVFFFLDKLERRGLRGVHSPSIVTSTQCVPLVMFINK